MMGTTPNIDLLEATSTLFGHSLMTRLLVSAITRPFHDERRREMRVTSRPYDTNQQHNAMGCIIM